MSVQQDIEDIVAPLVADLGYEFVGLEYQSNPKNRVVRIFIDHPETGIGVDDCALVSREVSALMDVEDPVKGHYTLEVSSPGLERPLFTAEHYERFAGERAVIHLFAPLEGRRKFTGVLSGVREEGVLIQVDTAESEPVHLAFDNIRKAHLAPDLEGLTAEDKS